MHGRLAFAETHVLEFLLPRCRAFDDLAEGVDLGGEVARRLDIPAGDEVEHAGAVDAGHHRRQAGFLLRALVLLADERWIAEDVVEPRRRHELGPVELQGVAVADMRALHQRDAQDGLAEDLAGLNVHLVVGQPHRDLRHLRREFLDLDAVELVDVDRDRLEDVAPALAEFLGGAQHLDFDPPQFAVADDEEIAATAGGIEERESREFFLELEQLVLVALDLVELRPQLVEEQRADQLEDVRFAGVVRAELAAAVARVEFDHGLKHGAENGRRDRAPVHRAQLDQQAAHFRVEHRRVEAFLEQAAIHVGKGGEDFGQGLLAAVGRRAEHDEQAMQFVAEIGGILGGMVLDQVLQRVLGLENARVVGEQAEQQAHQENFEYVALVTVALEQVVQVAHLLHRFDVDRILLAHFLPAVAGDEAEQVHLVREFLERQLVGYAVFQVVQDDAPEIGNDDVTRKFLIRQALEIVGGLLKGRIEVGARAFVFGQQQAGPEHVDAPHATMLEAGNRLFIDRHAAALDAENGEELVPESLRLGPLGGGVRPFLGEALRVGADVGPEQRHDEASRL